MIHRLAFLSLLIALPAYGLDPNMLPEPQRECHFRGAAAAMYMVERQTSGKSLDAWIARIDRGEADMGAEAAQALRRLFRLAYQTPRLDDREQVSRAVTAFGDAQVEACYREHGLTLPAPTLGPLLLP